jgi:plasmid maintenance system antidote protein VapI
MMDEEKEIQKFERNFPSSILREKMEKKNISRERLAMLTEYDEDFIQDILDEKQRITEDFALELEKIFPKYNAEFWLKVEMDHRLKQSRSCENETLEQLLNGVAYFIIKRRKYIGEELDEDTFERYDLIVKEIKRLKKKSKT